MSTWFPEKPTDDDHDDRFERSLYGGKRVDTPATAFGESHAAPSRRSAHAAEAQDAHLGRSSSTVNDDTQFMPPFTEDEEDPVGTGRQGFPAHSDEPTGGFSYESSGRSTRPGGGRRVAGGFPTPPDEPGARSRGSAATASSPREPRSGFGTSLGPATGSPGAPYPETALGFPARQDPVPARQDPVPARQDPAPGLESFRDLAPGSSSGEAHGTPSRESPSTPAGFPDSQHSGPADPQQPGRPRSGPGGGLDQSLTLPSAGPGPSVERSRGGEPHGSVPGQSLGRMLAAFAWPVMAFGLFFPEPGYSAFSKTPAWSAFALFCLVLVGVGAFGGSQGPGVGRTFTFGVIGASGLVVFWVLLVLPEIQRNTSFALSLGTTLAAFAMWLTSGRRRG